MELRATEPFPGDVLPWNSELRNTFPFPGDFCFWVNSVPYPDCVVSCSVTLSWVGHSSGRWTHATSFFTMTRYLVGRSPKYCESRIPTARQHCIIYIAINSSRLIRHYGWLFSCLKINRKSFVSQITAQKFQTNCAYRPQKCQHCEDILCLLKDRVVFEPFIATQTCIAVNISTIHAVTAAIQARLSRKKLL